MVFGGQIVTDSRLGLIFLSYTGLKVPLNITSKILLTGKIFKISANIGMDYEKQLGFDLSLYAASISIGAETVGAEFFYGAGVGLSIENYKLNIKFGVGIGASLYIDLSFLFKKPRLHHPAPIWKD